MAVDETAAEVYARFTVKQVRALAKLRHYQAEVVRLTAITDAAKADVTVGIYNLLELGVPVRFVAEELGVSQSRIYQIRDEVAAIRSGA